MGRKLGTWDIVGGREGVSARGNRVWVTARLKQVPLLSLDTGGRAQLLGVWKEEGHKLQAALTRRPLMMGETGLNWAPGGWWRLGVAAEDCGKEGGQEQVRGGEWGSK